MKVRADSLWAKLDEEQRHQLMSGLVHGSLSLADAAKLCSGWLQKRVPEQRVSATFQRHCHAWKLPVAKQAALELEEVAPADLDAKTRRALGQRKFSIVMEDLDATGLAALERNELMKQKLELDRQRLLLDQEKLSRLVAAKLSDLLELERANRSAGITGDEAVEAIRRRLFGEAAA